jgi:GTPase Era involved in 16S rRNA processing
VVVGEFNAGKSALINALLGARVIEEGVTPTTLRVGILQYGAETALPRCTPELGLDSRRLLRVRQPAVQCDLHSVDELRKR